MESSHASIGWHWVLCLVQTSGCTFGAVPSLVGAQIIGTQIHGSDLFYLRVICSSPHSYLGGFLLPLSSGSGVGYGSGGCFLGLLFRSCLRKLLQRGNISLAPGPISG